MSSFAMVSALPVAFMGSVGGMIPSVSTRVKVGKLVRQLTSSSVVSPSGVVNLQEV